MTIKPIRRQAGAGVLGVISGLKEEQPAEVDLPLRGGRGVRQLDLLPEGLAEVARRIGEERARAVQRLREKGILGTVPELCVYDWLEGRRHQFQFQSSLAGGRRDRGGAVVDFLIGGLSSAGWYVWRVQGEYWHQGAEVELKDEVQVQRLRGLRIGGVPVVAVVDLWESDIYDSYPRVFWMAEVGEGLRG